MTFNVLSDLWINVIAHVVYSRIHESATALPRVFFVDEQPNNRFFYVLKNPHANYCLCAQTANCALLALFNMRASTAIFASPSFICIFWIIEHDGSIINQ